MRTIADAKVAIQKCDSYHPDAMDAAVEAAFQLLGGGDTLLNGSGPCLVKPNLLSANPADAGITTHPAVVGAVCKALRGTRVKVRVGDSPGRGDTLEVAETAGIAGAARRSGAEMVAFDDEVAVRNPGGRVCKQFTLARAVSEADTVINVPKMKTHGFMMYTGAVKNLFGCIPGTRKAALHLRYQDPAEFSEMLLDLYELVRPAASVLDAVMAMDGEGPSHGRVRPFGAILVSRDAVALDTVAVHLANGDPMRVPYLAAARERGSGETRLENIEILGERLDSVQVHDFQFPGGRYSRLLNMGSRARRIMTAYPSVDPTKCTGCGECGRACPVKGIVVNDGKAVIDHGPCIRCYCCHEMCPRGAIVLKRGRFAELTRRVLDAFDRR